MLSLGECFDYVNKKMQKILNIKNIPVLYEETKKKRGIMLTDYAWQGIQEKALKLCSGHGTRKRNSSDRK